MKKWVIYLIGLILLIISFIFDKQIVGFIANNRVAFLNPLFIFIDNITEWPILFLLTFIILYFKKRSLTLRFSLLYFFTLVIIFFLRILTKIPRPDTALTNISAISFEYSFPSGHATTVFLLLPLFIKLYPKQKYLWILIAIIIPLSRLYTGFHYLSDIIFGVFLGYSLSHLLFLNDVNRKNS